MLRSLCRISKHNRLRFVKPIGQPRFSKTLCRFYLMAVLTANGAANSPGEWPLFRREIRMVGKYYRPLCRALSA